ncbi:hypothetical protein [Microcoleus sp. SVA1_A4]|uniref:hypothetical protein n=1 Tax=Microcoleus sp. SVA1_A4 TaxID=2818948 RepID=UPI002FCF0210
MVFVGTQQCCVLFFSVGRDGGDRFFADLLILYFLVMMNHDRNTDTSLGNRN